MPFQSGEYFFPPRLDSPPPPHAAPGCFHPGQTYSSIPSLSTANYGRDFSGAVFCGPLAKIGNPGPSVYGSSLRERWSLAPVKSGSGGRSPTDAAHKAGVLRERVYELAPAGAGIPFSKNILFRTSRSCLFDALNNRPMLNDFFALVK